MDFGSLLYTAHKNEKNSNKEVKCYKTKFDPPKKEVKTKTNLSANIQKYLQKREEEERRKAEEERRKKEELLALRSQDKKAFKRVQTMLKRTKSANKSVMEDAIDEVNTVVTMAGPQQCDEDDYGYVSQEASALYAKLMDKYASMPPEEPKFSQSKKPVVKDLNAAKDRVRAALQREEEEEMMPHKRKRKSKGDKNDEENGEEENESRRERSREQSPVEEPKHKKPKKMAPPPIDFSSLLKLAEQKQFEPIKIEKKVEDEERPMTKRQKLEYERELESRRRREEREAMRHAALSKSSGDRKEKPNGLGRIPKKSDSSEGKPKLDRPTDDTKRKNSLESENDYRKPKLDRPTDDTKRKNSLESEYDYRKNSNSIDSDNSRDKFSDVDRPRSNYDSRKDKYSDVDRSRSYDSSKSKHADVEKSRSSNDSRKDKYSDLDRSKSSYDSSREKNFYSDRSRNSYESNEDRKTGSSLSHKTDDRRPLKPTQPSVAYNKMKSRSHDLSDDQSEASDSGYNHSEHHSSDKNRQNKLERERSNFHKNQSSKSSQDSSSNYRERNGYKGKYSNSDNEGSDSQSGSDSKKYPSKSSGPSTPKYKSDTSYKSDKEKSSYNHKTPVKKPSSSNNRERSYSPQNNRYERYRRESYSESEPEDENIYRPSKKESSLQQKSQYHEKQMRSDEERSQSPDCSKIVKKRRGSYSEPENEPSMKKAPSSKLKKISSLFEGSDEESPSHRHNNRTAKDNETRKHSLSFDREVQKYPTSESKFKIPKASSKSDLDKNRMTERNDKHKSIETSRSSSSSISKPSNKDTIKQYPEPLKSERPHPSPKLNVDKHQSSREKVREKPRISTDTPKGEISKENNKKPSQNAEEMLKKSANVWSKPCNLTPNSSAPRPPNTLSESQLQRLREMNKKPIPSKPPEDRLRPVTSERKPGSLHDRPNPRDERNPDGRPLPLKPIGSKQSLLMKAAAERGAMLKAQQTSSRSSDSDRPTSKSSEQRPTLKQQSSSASSKPREQPIKDSRPKSGELKPKQFPPNDLKPRQFPPNDLKPKQFPPKDVRPRQFPPPDVKKKPKPRRIEDDSEDEYDSEMDSFIDDGSDLNQEEISKQIQEIFGYDKSRYAYMDDDDECMESNFGQIDREELRSLQIGAREDYEELMKDLRRKKMLKKRKEMEKMGSR